MTLFLWIKINLIQYIVSQILFIYIFLLTKKAKILIYCLQQSSSSVILKNCIKWRINLVSVSCFRHSLYTLLLLYTLGYLWCKYKHDYYIIYFESENMHLRGWIRLSGCFLMLPWGVRQVNILVWLSSLHLSVKLGSLEMQRWETGNYTAVETGIPREYC